MPNWFGRKDFKKLGLKHGFQIAAARTASLDFFSFSLFFISQPLSCSIWNHTLQGPRLLRRSLGVKGASSQEREEGETTGLNVTSPDCLSNCTTVDRCSNGQVT